MHAPPEGSRPQRPARRPARPNAGGVPSSQETTDGALSDRDLSAEVGAGPHGGELSSPEKEASASELDSQEAAEAHATVLDTAPVPGRAEPSAVQDGQSVPDQLRSEPIVSPRSTPRETAESDSDAYVDVHDAPSLDVSETASTGGVAHLDRPLDKINFKDGETVAQADSGATPATVDSSELTTAAAGLVRSESASPERTDASERCLEDRRPSDSDSASKRPADTNRDSSDRASRSAEPAPDHAHSRGPTEIHKNSQSGSVAEKSRPEEVPEKSRPEEVPEKSRPEVPKRPTAKPKMARAAMFEDAAAEAPTKPRLPPKPRGSKIGNLRSSLFADLNTALAKGPPGTADRRSSSIDQGIADKPEEETEPAPAPVPPAITSAPRARARGPKRRLPAEAKPSFTIATSTLWKLESTPSGFNDSGTSPGAKILETSQPDMPEGASLGSLLLPIASKGDGAMAQLDLPALSSLVDRPLSPEVAALSRSRAASRSSRGGSADLPPSVADTVPDILEKMEARQNAPETPNITDTDLPPGTPERVEDVESSTAAVKVGGDLDEISAKLRDTQPQDDDDQTSLLPDRGDLTQTPREASQTAEEPTHVREHERATFEAVEPSGGSLGLGSPTEPVSPTDPKPEPISFLGDKPPRPVRPCSRPQLVPRTLPESVPESEL